MKYSANDLSRFCAKPDPKLAGLLLYGEDVMRVALRRQEAMKAILGPNGDTEMRAERLSGSDLRSDPAILRDALKAVGFFPGPRAIFVEEISDANTAAIAAALEDWQQGDAVIVAVAGQLRKNSSLRKLFETARNAAACALYSDPMGRAEIEAELKRAGLRDVARDALTALEHLARDLPPGDFRQMLEKTALYKLNDPEPLTALDVSLNAPASIEAHMDALLHVLGDGRANQIAPLMARLAAQGTLPVTLLIRAAQHFRTLYLIAGAHGGPAQGIARLRPPLFGPRRDLMLRQARAWSTARLEAALQVIMDTDLTLRSAGQKAPANALVERAFMRLAYMARAGER